MFLLLGKPFVEVAAGSLTIYSKDGNFCIAIQLVENDGERENRGWSVVAEIEEDILQSQAIDHPYYPLTFPTHAAIRPLPRRNCRVHPLKGHPPFLQYRQHALAPLRPLFTSIFRAGGMIVDGSEGVWGATGAQRVKRHDAQAFKEG